MMMVDSQVEEASLMKTSRSNSFSSPHEEKNIYDMYEASEKMV